MSKKALTAMVALLMLAGTAAAQSWTFSTDKTVYGQGEPVSISVTNTGISAIVGWRLEETLTIALCDPVLMQCIPVYEHCGPIVQNYVLHPGETWEWIWDGRYDIHYGTQCVPDDRNGQYAPTGQYIVTSYYGTRYIQIIDDCPGHSDDHRKDDNGRSNACVLWASNEHSKGRENARS